MVAAGPRRSRLRLRLLRRPNLWRHMLPFASEPEPHYSCVASQVGSFVLPTDHAAVIVSVAHLHPTTEVTVFQGALTCPGNSSSGDSQR